MLQMEEEAEEVEELEKVAMQYKPPCTLCTPCENWDMS